MFDFIVGDALRIINSIEDESIDLVITDPPYASLEKHRAIGTTTRLKDNWFPVVQNNYLVEVVSELYRILKNNTHCYIMSDQETHYVIRDAAIKAGFTWKKFLVWDKQCIGMGYSWRAKHEVVCYLEKGKRKLNNLSMSDVLSHKRVHNGYPTEKPVSLFNDLVINSSNEGELVFDPFTGSGSSMEAALSSNRIVVGVDINKSQCEAIELRLQGFTRQRLLTPKSQLMLI
jgi:site-specific DNA-methyltransferase (adenine-specific)